MSTNNGLLTWSLVVPVKPTRAGKSRLAPYAGRHRPSLAAAMALDTVEAARLSALVARVIVVTDDPRLRTEIRALGELVLTDSPAAGLNAAVTYGATMAWDRWPTDGVAAMSADLPALRPAELDRVLAAAAVHSTAFVADAPGIGTTLYMATPGAAFTPMFGPRSRAAHTDTGAVDLALEAIDSVRRDVDTETDLEQALDLGVGSRTRHVLVAAGALL